MTDTHDQQRFFIAVSDEPPQRSRYVRSWNRLRLSCIGCVCVCLLLTIPVVIDWVIWTYRDRKIVTTASEMGGRISGLMGWPFGYEYGISFDFVPSDGQLSRLAVLNNPPRWSSVESRSDPAT